ncbi:MAG: sulfurtransferase [Epsilonproteobacteria bacterium]|nr:sulfurtransferase [Campylobacterota bacterium]NPA88577.1 sulfurtransferase [Campylobacterota bacterium]
MYLFVTFLLKKGVNVKKSIDTNSPEFQEEFLKTEKFAHKVVKQFGWRFNPNEEIVERILKGLTNNKLLYGKRYCPCFVPQFDGTDRICPCKPAIEKEIPEEGVCHCGIFCTPQYRQKEEERLRQKKHHREVEIEGMKVGELEEILKKEQLTGRELEILLKARNRDLLSFKLVDIREPFEYQMMRIKGTDILLPISRFQWELEKWLKLKDERIIIYCHVGSRSGYLFHLLKEQLGFEKVSNLTYGIAEYPGEIERG